MTAYFSLVGIGSMFEFIVSIISSLFGKLPGYFHLQFSAKENSKLTRIHFRITGLEIWISTHFSIKSFYNICNCVCTQ